MTRKCFFIDQMEPSRERVTLTGETARHVRNVLRLKPGDPIELRDGGGKGWSGRIAAMDGEAVQIHVLQQQPLQSESPLEITLALAFSRLDRMELVVRQATELGVVRIVAFRAQRSQYGLHEDQRGKRIERWLKIAREALCQCGRMRLPDIVILSDVVELMSRAETWEGEDSLRIVACEEDGPQSLLDLWRLHPACRRVLATVGPEGGWTPQEVDQFLDAGFDAVHLGPRILRLETAAVAFLATTQLLWGDVGTAHEIREG